MYKQKLAIGISPSYTLPYEEQIELFKKVGFEECFIDDCNRSTDVEGLVKRAGEIGIGIQSMHAPFDRCADMWNTQGSDGDEALNELLAFEERCSENFIPVMVTHTWIGFYTGRKPTQAGIERYGKLGKRAGELGIKLALENTEGDEFLETLMRELKSEKAVGFCWDSGHEQCYNYGRDMLALYGDRLFATHLNDNLGIRNFDGYLTFHDDLHLLPFDGIIDWQNAASRISRCGYNGTLTFELKRVCQVGRFENRAYELMSPEDYITAAFERACKVGALTVRERESANEK